MIINLSDRRSIWSDNLQLLYIRRLEAIWDQITSNLLAYNLQLPYKYDMVIMVQRIIMVIMVKMLTVVKMVIMVEMVIMVVMHCYHG